MSGDADLRRLERAHRAEPLDAGILRRYVTALLRTGNVEAACAALSIRWEADSAALKNLWWRTEKLSPSTLRELVADDLAHPPKTVVLNQSILSVVNIMAEQAATAVVVLSDDDPTKPIAIFDRGDIIAAYNAQVTLPAGPTGL